MICVSLVLFAGLCLKWSEFKLSPSWVTVLKHLTLTAPLEMQPEVKMSSATVNAGGNPAID